MINCFNTASSGWSERLDALLDRVQGTPIEVQRAVLDIIESVKERGDEALFEYTRRFDRFDVAQEGLCFTADQMEAAVKRIPSDLLEALTVAAERIEYFHREQLEESWSFEEDGILLGQKIGPVSRVGIYIPGGKNAFPSTVLMNVIPARIAGVQEIVVVTPTPDGRINDALLAAAHIAGVNRIYRIGGAQAVAALAYGTESVPKVDKVVGPGNAYVAFAKRTLQGIIGIDAIAGPSEIMVVADEGADPETVAMDLLSQAEHDELASSMLITPSERLADEVRAALEAVIPEMPRAEVMRHSLSNHGAIIVTQDLDEAFRLVNRIAPEHLELMLADADDWLDRVQNAGAIFLGYHTPEGIGDYVAGPNHTLPTGSTARFYSPLGVYDFLKRSSVIRFSADAVAELGPKAALIARVEDLEAHARSVEYRYRP